MKLYSKSLPIVLVTIFFSTYTSQRQVAVPVVSTVPEAIVVLRKIIISAPSDDTAALQDYEKTQSNAIVQCAKVLYDNAYAQILDALEEIDNRVAYWRYQKNHTWRYFVTKSPVKWVTGASQDIEVNNNIEQLQSHQGELYVLLGQLAEYGNVYDHKHKTLFKNDYVQGYAWVDGLLDILVRIKVSVKNIDDVSPFIARVTLLKAKLERVRFFKNQILSEIKETQIPGHLERNWFWYGSTATLLGLGYQNISLEQVKNSWQALKDNINLLIIDPISNTIKDIFGGGKIDDELLISQKNIDVAKESIKNFVNTLSLPSDEKQLIVNDIEVGKSESFHALVDTLWSGWNPKKAAEGELLFDKFTILQAAGRSQKQISGVAKIAFLTPALLSSWAAHNRYQALMKKDYTLIRRALIDINSLFVDATKLLDDEQYGKMLYLVYDLKKRAVKDVPLQDQADFINDLNRIESKEFNVAAKRAIVDDMFRKYSFLRLS